MYIDDGVVSLSKCHDNDENHEALDEGALIGISTPGCLSLLDEQRYDNDYRLLIYNRKDRRDRQTERKHKRQLMLYFSRRQWRRERIESHERRIG